MNGLTENLYRTLSALPQEDVSAQGESLVDAVWAQARRCLAGKASGPGVSAGGRLVATDLAGGLIPVESAAFNNTLRYAGLQVTTESASAAAQRVCCAVPVFAAMALAEARGADCARFGTLPWIDHEVLADHRQVAGCAGCDQVVLMALEVRRVGQHR